MKLRTLGMGKSLRSNEEEFDSENHSFFSENVAENSDVNKRRDALKSHEIMPTEKLVQQLTDTQDQEETKGYEQLDDASYLVNS